MRTPEEIKMALNHCSERAERKTKCSECVYFKDGRGWCSTAITRDALAYIQQLEEQQPRWISVRERLPEKRGYYLVACGGDIPRVLYFRGKMWAVSQSHYYVPEYWVELPKPPKEG